MNIIQALEGKWIFDEQDSQISSPPTSWIQQIAFDGNRIRVREHISRLTGSTTVALNAVPDDGFFPVAGSPIADEISYSIEGDVLVGIGRKQGVISFREVISLSELGRMEAEISFVIGAKEVKLGVARFKRVEQSPA